MNLKKFDGAKFSEYRIVSFDGELYQVSDIMPNTFPVEDIYRLLKLVHIFGKPEYITANESELEDYTKKLKYVLDIKGYFSTILKDTMTRRKYVDLKLGYGDRVLFCTQDEFSELSEEYFANDDDFKVIGVHIYELTENGEKK